MVLKLKLKLNCDSQSFYLGVGFLSGTHYQIFVFRLPVVGFLLWSTLSDERMGL
jgi:hypothetical protein